MLTSQLAANLIRTLAAGMLMMATAACATGPATVAHEAVITRTTYGIPHIKAKNVAGLGFGSAYAQAEDNICLMADAYVTGSGERSKYFGAKGKTQIAVFPASNLESDIFYQAIVDDATLEANFAKGSEDAKALLNGWVAGYNRFLVDHMDTLPAACAGQPWVKPITRVTLLRWINGFGLFASSSGLGVKIAQTAPPVAGAKQKAETASTPVLALDAETSRMTLGSNGWAFGADATTNGRGLVVANPHFPWIGPYRFYEMHQTIPGKLDVAGAGAIGQPYVGIGFNKDVAWTHTVDTAVHMTLSKLTLDPTDPTAYVIDGKREAMGRLELTIEDKDGPPIKHTIYSSRHGLIMSWPVSPYAWTNDTAYAVTDANRGNVRGADTYLAFAKATSVGGLRDALIRYRGPAFVNTIAADRHGDAMFADITPAPNVSAEQFVDCGTRGLKDPALYARLYILDGSRADCSWKVTAGSDLLPGAEMVAQLRRDYVQNSNDSYRWTNLALAPAERAPMLGEDPAMAPDMRTRAGLEEITRVLASGKFDAKTAAAAMLSDQNFAGPRVLPAMLELCQRPSAPKPACDALAQWDGRADLSSRGAMLFQMFWSKAGPRPNLWSVPFNPADPINTPAKLIIDGAAGDALLADLTAASQLLGILKLPLDAPLGEIQFAERGNERIPISGLAYGGTLNYIGGAPGTKGGVNVIHGSSYIQSVTFDEKGPVADAILTFSQSTDPTSPHYADQTRAFSQKKLRRYPFWDADIKADALGPPKVVAD